MNDPALIRPPGSAPAGAQGFGSTPAHMPQVDGIPTRGTWGLNTGLMFSLKEDEGLAIRGEFTATDTDWATWVGRNPEPGARPVW